MSGVSNGLIGFETRVIGVRTVDRRLELGRVDGCGVVWCGVRQDVPPTAREAPLLTPAARA